MNNEDYLNLFKKIQEQEDENQNPELQSLNETPNFEEYGNPEVKNFSQYQNLNEVQITPDINESVNDAWSQNIEIETRVNGQVVKRGNANPDPYTQRQRTGNNGLDQYLQEDNLNEVVKNRQNVNTNLTNVQNEVKNEQSDIDTRALKESSMTYKDSDVVTAEMWHNWCQASIYPLALNLKQL